MLLIAYPYVVAGGFAVNDKTPETGLYDAHFGLILDRAQRLPRTATSARTARPPQQRGNRPMNENARCTEPAASSNAARRAERPSGRAGLGRRRSRRTIATRGR